MYTREIFQRRTRIVFPKQHKDKLTTQYNPISVFGIPMCGIFSLLNNNSHFSHSFIQQQFQKGKGRGPEYSSLSDAGIKILFGFHRLAINGLNPESNQPICQNDIQLICNGEIYNYRELYEMMEIEPETESDCEVIIHLYKRYGIEYTLQVLDGVFSFLLLDNNLKNLE